MSDALNQVRERIETARNLGRVFSADTVESMINDVLKFELSKDVLDAIKRSRDVAMRYAAAARIPECGKFAEIAQDLDWVVSELQPPRSLQPDGNVVAYYKCSDCGHEQKVRGHRYQGEVYLGSGADFCDMCDGVPKQLSIKNVE